jgi:hypothetical protein
MYVHAASGPAPSTQSTRGRLKMNVTGTRQF